MDKNSGTRDGINKEAEKEGRRKKSKRKGKETEESSKSCRQREGVNDGSSCDIDPAHWSPWRELQ